MSASRAVRASSVPPAALHEVMVHLTAGQVHASSDPCTIATVLGSCVAVCLVDRARRAGGANHFVLPYRVAGHRATPRFAHASIEALVARMLSLGCERSSLQAKVFGGASMLPTGAAPRVSLGEQNVDAARAALAEQAIPIVAEDVGGDRGRKMIFRTDLGDVWIRKL